MRTWGSARKPPRCNYTSSVSALAEWRVRAEPRQESGRQCHTVAFWSSLCFWGFVKYVDYLQPTWQRLGLCIGVIIATTIPVLLQYSFPLFCRGWLVICPAVKYSIYSSIVRQSHSISGCIWKTDSRMQIDNRR